MALSAEDHRAILRHLQSEVRRADPELHALVVEHVESRDDTGRYLLDYLSVLARVMSERSAGSHGRVLNLLNQSVRTESGGPVRGLRLELTPTERDLLQREHVDLAELPDRSELVEALLSLHNDIARDREEGGNQR
jgi:hypothetical protein